MSSVGAKNDQRSLQGNNLVLPFILSLAVPDGGSVSEAVFNRALIGSYFAMVTVCFPKCENGLLCVIVTCSRLFRGLFVCF
jgi:hypothetical protein